MLRSILERGTGVVRLLTIALALPVLGGSAGAAVLTRGPYLQNATADGMVLRWRTDVAVDSRVLCGPAPGSLTVCAEELTATTEHEIALSGLTPDTQYFYAVGTTTAVLAGDDADHFFYSSPPVGAPHPMRIWAIGDFGTGNAGQEAVRDAFYAYTAGTHTDLWLMLGDNAYSTGTDAEYGAKVFDFYPELLRRTVSYPTLGNHDGSSSSATQTGPFFDVFTLPANAQGGGVASETEAYYSFDYANVHFVVLNSFDLPRTPGSEMLVWLESDLADTSKDWIIAIWHHPPYSKGGHDSDVETALVEMRQYAVPILENHGVDLVLTGHSHSYERSYLIDGHYGLSDQIDVCDDAGTPTNPADDFCAGDPLTDCPGGIADCDTGGFLVNAGDGRQTGDGVYEKPLLGPDPHRGAVYAVAGTGGQVPGGGTFDHPAMFIGLSVLGSLVVDVDGERLDATFIDHTTGVALDSFSIEKGLDCPAGPYADNDGDGVCNDLDVCPDDADPNQEDSDGDGLGDACDACPDDALNDVDTDGVCGDVDNCPDDPNTDQLDDDGDLAGNACDPCPFDADDDGDGDGFCADVDNCPALSNPLQLDDDADGSGNACDACPLDPLDDADADGFCADVDNCPDDFNPCQIDTDGDGTGNVCDASDPGNCNAFVKGDSWLEEDSPNAKHGNDTRLESMNEQEDDRRPVLRFDLSAVPLGSTIVSATGWVWVLGADETGQPVEVHRITSDWEEPHVRWIDLANDFDPLVAATLDTSIEDVYTSFDLTTLTREWIDGTHPNHGVMFLSTSNGERTDFASEERLGGAFKACIDILFQCLTPDQDSDGDGTPDSTDGCPNDPAKIEPGLCGCGSPDTDTDSDGTPDCDDGCTDDPNKIDPGLCGCGTPETDSDLDGNPDCLDACPDDPDDDLDDDGICGDADNCPENSNSEQADADGDGLGDVCDACVLDADDDADGDGICADADNCAGVANPTQADGDLDGAGDACDTCALDPDDDLDADGHCGDVDNCPATSNPGQEDTDEDGVGDACESPGDADGDLVPDTLDNCPLVPNPVQRDLDGDGTGDACDADDDGDGVDDPQDCAPLSPAVTTAPTEVGNSLRIARTPAGAVLAWSRGVQGHVSHVYRGDLAVLEAWPGSLDCVDFARADSMSLQIEDPASGALFYYLVSAANVCGESPLGQSSQGTPHVAGFGCPLGANDLDGDGAPDAEDNCPLTGNPDLSDVDQDFIGDVCDNCPSVPNHDQADSDEDGRGDLCEGLVDQDDDGIEDSADNCPGLFNTGQEDGDADGLGDVCDPCPADPTNPTDDADGDGTPDCSDLCPDDPGKVQPGGCGCGVADVDTDLDGALDCVDECPADPGPDPDGDGVCSSADNCPAVYNPCQIDTDADQIGNRCDTFGPESCNVFVEADSWLRESSSEDNFGTDNELENRSFSFSSRRSVLRFDLPAALLGADLVSARVRLFVTDGDSQPVDVHRITQNWSEATVNWDSTASDFAPNPVGSFTPADGDEGVVVDLTGLVQGWLAGTWPNHGMMLRSTSFGNVSRFVSKEGTLSDQHPCMEIIPECTP